MQSGSVSSSSKVEAENNFNARPCLLLMSEWLNWELLVEPYSHALCSVTEQVPLNLGEEDFTSLSLIVDHIILCFRWVYEGGSCDKAPLGKGQHGEAHGGGEKRIEA